MPMSLKSLANSRSPRFPFSRLILPMVDSQVSTQTSDFNKDPSTVFLDP